MTRTPELIETAGLLGYTFDDKQTDWSPRYIAGRDNRGRFQESIMIKADDSGFWIHWQWAAFMRKKPEHGNFQSKPDESLFEFLTRYELTSQELQKTPEPLTPHEWINREYGSVPPDRLPMYDVLEYAKYYHQFKIDNK